MKVCLLFVFLVCGVSEIFSQICTKRAVFTKLVPETQMRYMITTYRSQWCFRRPCIKTKKSLVQHATMVEKTVVQIKKFCCDGYMTNSTSLRLQCDPVCIPSCENGYCSQPGVCACNEGYAPSPESNRKCLPICTKECEHGTCVEPEKCMCNFGYHAVMETCVPICTNPCTYGICIAPDRCECLPGYRNNGTETCYPYCSNDCPHGTCVSPENCVCDEGWHKKEPDGLCEPICTQDCGHGTCVSPNTCECFEHYITSENGTCVPFCTSGCPHGSCVGPENCTCNNGWFKTEPDGICKPVCEDGCEHGTCVSPNECVCHPHYNKSKDGLCVPYCSSGCPHGSCVAPEICKCDEGWSTNSIECIPVCSPACGNGTCIAPDVCQCYPGYENLGINTDSSFQAYDVCVPKCRNCDGKCVAPDQCFCDPPSVAVSVTVDGAPCDCYDNCLDDTTMCDRTICIEGYTTTDATDYTEDILSTYDIDVTFGDDVATGNPDDNSTESYINNFTDVASITVSENKSFPHWVYIVVSVVLVTIMVIIIVLVVKRQTINYYFDKGDYYVKDDQGDDTIEITSNETVQYSDLVKNKATV